MIVIDISVGKASIYNDPMKPPKTAKTILKFERARVGIVIDSCKNLFFVPVILLLEQATSTRECSRWGTGLEQ